MSILEHEISSLFSTSSSTHKSLLVRDVTAEFMWPVIRACYVTFVLQPALTLKLCSLSSEGIRWSVVTGSSRKNQTNVSAQSQHLKNKKKIPLTNKSKNKLLSHCSFQGFISDLCCEPFKKKNPTNKRSLVYISIWPPFC